MLLLKDARYQAMINKLHKQPTSIDRVYLDVKSKTVVQA